MNQKHLNFISMGLIVGLFATLTVNAIRSEGNDFKVFYDASKNYFTGQKLYSIERDGGRCYKYPAYVTPLFSWTALFPINIASVLWRIFLIFCLAWLTFQLYLRRISIPLIALSIVPMWGVWMNNIVSGQSAIFLTTLSFFGFQCIESSKKKSSLGWLTLLMGLSMKVFNLFALISFEKSHWKKKGLLSAIGILVILGAPAIIGSDYSLVQLLKEYIVTISTPTGVTQGGNYSFPHLFQFLLHDYTSGGERNKLSLLLSFLLVIAVYLHAHRRIKDPYEKFSAALALSICLHPLSFQYSFASVFHLVAFSLHHTFKRFGAKSLQFQIGLIGIAMICLVNETYLGSLGKFLDLFKPKSWGVVILVAILSWKPKKLIR